MSKTAKILLVEDDALSLKLMREVLHARGFTTEGVSEGASVLAHVLSQRADLVIMDIGLPGMDGVEATKQLRNHPLTERLPVVAVTAYAMPEDERRVREAGCDAFFTKPLVLRDLVAEVERLLDWSARP